MSVIYLLIFTADYYKAELETVPIQDIEQNFSLL